MPNLVKFNLVVREDDKRVINSNELVAAKIKQLSDASKYVEGEEYDNEFSDLIQVDRVERLLADQADTPIAVSQDAEEIRRRAESEAEAILEQARQEAEDLREQGFRQGEEQGYQEGHKKGMEEAEAMKQQLAIEKQDLERRYQKQLEEMEPALVDTLIEILESAFTIQFADKKDFIMHLLQSAFSKIENSKEYLIRISKEDYPVLQEKKEELRKELPRNASVELVEDMTLSKNQCLIETDGGVFDCSLDTQMENLTRDLKMLASI